MCLSSQEGPKPTCFVTFADRGEHFRGGLGGIDARRIAEKRGDLQTLADPPRRNCWRQAAPVAVDRRCRRGCRCRGHGHGRITPPIRGPRKPRGRARRGCGPHAHAQRCNNTPPRYIARVASGTAAPRRRPQPDRGAPCAEPQRNAALACSYDADGIAAVSPIGSTATLAAVNIGNIGSKYSRRSSNIGSRSSSRSSSSSSSRSRRRRYRESFGRTAPQGDAHRRCRCGVLPQWAR